MRSVTRRPRSSRWTGGSRRTATRVGRGPGVAVRARAPIDRGQRRGGAPAGPGVPHLVDVAAFRDGRARDVGSDAAALWPRHRVGRTSATRYAARCVPPPSRRAGPGPSTEADRMLADGTVTVGARIPTRHGPAHGQCHRPLGAGLCRRQPRTAAPGRSRRSTRVPARPPGSVAKRRRRSPGWTSSATSPARC